MIDFLDIANRFQIESNERWREWGEKLPYFKFDSDWEVKIIPAFAGALVRFVIKKNDKTVSVYFDSESKLGYMYDENGNPIPYFEIYTNSTYRYLLDETEKMINDIRKYLN